jgi:hypothetical protein
MGGVLGWESAVAGGSDRRCALRGTPAPSHYCGYLAFMID